MRTATNGELERVAGIEPASLAWKARALPLSYTRPLTLLLRGDPAPRKQFGALATIHTDSSTTGFALRVQEAILGSPFPAY